ncbi:alpha-glucosidase [Hespellia stercorisuis]|uniref:Oligo-1,6-glucosidase n=1 Tax=Hespellia stercorisuis DSM 15480 TaxID=1121950 RepID=A0A1M6QX54_9FIRM|nr:alpha-glucosidase [Hespellia stercorisuis]SHK24766.1 oligo-1,6-glucosidase [Hespellia stercorisuis DSM 15480]
MEKDWYKRMSFYQIWIRSFYDGNGDGIGDLAGVYEKLPYIQSLGVDGIWFSPLYPSPNADFGYDISDYKNIHPDYGDLEQFQKVLDRAHEMGMKVIMDLVINHTSDEHPWFVESRKSRDNPYSDYYIWKDAKNGRLPNNWNSLFEGKAWEYAPERNQYYLHLFAKKQPDLNMDNPKVREEVKEIMRFWLSMGVDGFREDVITFISKADGLPNGLPLIPAANGMHLYKDGPHIHEYLAEFRKVCEEYDCFQLGEGPMTTTESALSYMTGEKKSLDLMFHFDHMMADCLFTEYIQRPFKLTRLKRAFRKWQHALNGKAWNTLYLENHDHPRVISRYGNEAFVRESGTMLAVCYLFQQGTPFVYQGQEIGMLNIHLDSIDQYMDVSSKNNYHSFHRRESREKRMARIHASSRDSSRTPMQWNDSSNAGFTTGTPWFYVNPNYKEINVEKEEREPDSILNFYRRCLHYRKKSETALWGDYREFRKYDNRIYMYERRYHGKSLLIVCSFSTKNLRWRMPKECRGWRKKLVLCNYGKSGGKGSRKNGAGKTWRLLRPYEARVYEMDCP